MNFVQCMQDFSSQYGLITTLLLGGLAGGFTHCVGMCAPFVLAQGEPEYQNRGVLARLSGALLIPYHLGRMSTYVLLGFLFYSVLNLAILFSDMRVILTAPILMMAGTLFLISMFPALSKVFPWMARLQFYAPIHLISRYSGYFLNNPGFIQRYLLGVILGFMPCGLVLAAIMASSTASSAAQAVLAMSAFSIGTMPALFLVSLGRRGIRLKFPKAEELLRQLSMMISALWLFALAGWMMI